MPRKKPIDKLTDWEWTTLVASWRYYEYGHTIVSASFPGDIVSRFFMGQYSSDVCKRIARQFAIIDHGTNGEDDWRKWGTQIFQCDLTPWSKFYRFCEGYVNGFHKVVLSDGKETEEVYAFHVKWSDRWYPVDKYLKSPHVEQYCAPEFIVSIDGKPYTKGGEK